MIRSAVGALLSVLATTVRLGASVVAGLIALHALFVFFAADPANPLVEFASDLRHSLGGLTVGLFTPDDPRLAETVNTLFAAALWSIAGGLVSRALTGLVPRAPDRV
ncbi:hypothetical protein [Modestobacter sp. SYSU DS0657]